MDDKNKILSWTDLLYTNKEPDTANVGELDTTTTDAETITDTTLQLKLLQSHHAPVEQAPGQEERKAFQAFDSVLQKFWAFCDKTWNVHRELKDGVSTALNAYKLLGAAHARQQAMYASKRSTNETSQTKDA